MLSAKFCTANYIFEKKKSQEKLGEYFESLV